MLCCSPWGFKLVLLIYLIKGGQLALLICMTDFSLLPPFQYFLLRSKMTFLFLLSLLLFELALSTSLTYGYSKYVYKAIKIIGVFMVTWNQSLEMYLYPRVFVYHCAASLKNNENQAALILCVSVLLF